MANLLADSRACEFNQSAAGAGRIGGKWGTGPCLPELSEWPGNTSLDLPHCSRLRKRRIRASSAALSCAALSTRELVTPYSRYIFGQGEASHRSK